MPLTTGDIFINASANMPESDDVVSGGAINTGVLVTFNDISASDVVEIISDNAADNRTGIIYGRTSDGTPVNESLVLNGTTPVTGAQNFGRINKIQFTAPAAGNITVRKGSDNVTIANLPPGVTGIRRLFINSAAEAAGGGTRQFYEKIFIRNGSSTNALLNGVVSEFSDPTTFVDFALESGYNGSSSVTGRLNSASALPVNSGSFNSSAKNMPSGQTLGVGSGLGVWLRLQLPAGTSPSTGTWTINVAGSTT